MKALMTAVALLSLMASLPVQAQDRWVNGYTRRDGTTVQGHYRTRSDGNPWNNYSTQGNINPYTGERGSVNPYNATPSFDSPYGGGSYPGGSIRRGY